MRRAFTLIEVVLSLALLGTLAVAAVSWTTSSLRVQRRTLDATEQTRQLETLERLLRADLFNLDLTLPAAYRREERVWIDDDVLHVLTRDRGSAEVVYHFDPVRGAILRTHRPIQPGGQSSDSVLAMGIAWFHASLIHTGDTDRWWVLSVSVGLAGNDGGEESVELTLPREWTP